MATTFSEIGGPLIILYATHSHGTPSRRLVMSINASIVKVHVQYMYMLRGNLYVLCGEQKRGGRGGDGGKGGTCL